MKIRKAVKKDAPRLLELLAQIGRFHAEARPDVFRQNAGKYSLEEVVEIMQDPRQVIFTAVDTDDTVEGYVMCVFRETPDHPTHRKTPFKYLWVDDFCVDEKLRGERIGSQLLDYVKDFAREEGCSRVELDVWEFSGSAEPFYEKEGFTTQARRMECWL